MRQLLLPFLVLSVAAPAAAQVGHDPGDSPYRDVAGSIGVSALAGWFGGGGGSLEVGPHDGWMYGGRFDLKSNRAIALGIGVLYGTLQRRVLDPYAPKEERDKGLVDQNVLIPEAVITMNLTGGKTWHRLGPFIGFGVGAAIGEDTPSDTSGYSFGTRFSFAPFAGVRFMATPRLGIRGEVRGNLWKLSFPISYRSTNDNGDVIIVDGSVGEWVMSEVFIFGLSFYF